MVLSSDMTASATSVLFECCLWPPSTHIPHGADRSPWPLLTLQFSYASCFVCLIMCGIRRPLAPMSFVHEPRKLTFIYFHAGKEKKCGPTGVGVTPGTFGNPPLAPPTQGVRHPKIVSFALFCPIWRKFQPERGGAATAVSRCEKYLGCRPTRTPGVPELLTIKRWPAKADSSTTRESN